MTERRGTEPERGVYIDETGQEAIRRRPIIRIPENDKGKGPSEESELEESDSDDDNPTRLAKMSRNYGRVLRQHERVQIMNGNRRLGLPPVISVQGADGVNAQLPAVDPEDLELDEPIIVPQLRHEEIPVACFAPTRAMSFEAFIDLVTPDRGGASPMTLFRMLQSTPDSASYVWHREFIPDIASMSLLVARFVEAAAAIQGGICFPRLI